MWRLLSYGSVIGRSGQTLLESIRFPNETMTFLSIRLQFQ